MLWKAMDAMDALDAMESNAKENDNFTTKVISNENEEKNCKRSKKEEPNSFLFQVINFDD